MKPIDFKEANKTLTKPSGMTDKECGSLPTFNADGCCISCWDMSWKERFIALFRGKVWLYVYSGETQPPVSLGVKYPFKNEN